MKKLLLAMICGVLAMPVLAAPAPQACETQFYNKQMPDYSPKDNETVQIICFTQFGVEHSSVTKTPLWSAEYLTAERIRLAKEIKRKDQFHPEPTILFMDRSALADYVGSGYDRGHMSPDKDMPDALSMYESFSLANMIPQNPCNNEIIWKEIEIATRKYESSNGIYVVTGPIFSSDPQTIGGSKVAVPSQIFKAIYDPSLNALKIVVVDNANVQEFVEFTKDQLKDATGIDVFPGVVNAVALALPPLHRISGNCKKGQ